MVGCMYNSKDRLLIREDVRDYVGQWVAVYNHKVIAHGRDITEVVGEVKRNCPNIEPFFTYITLDSFVFSGQTNRLERALSCF